MKDKAITKPEADSIIQPIYESYVRISRLKKFLTDKSLDDLTTCTPREVNLIMKNIREARNLLNIARIRTDLYFNKEAHDRAERKWQAILKRKVDKKEVIS